MVTTYPLTVESGKSFDQCIIAAGFFVNDARVISGPSWISVYIGDTGGGTNNAVYARGTAPSGVPSWISESYTLTLYIEDLAGDSAQNVSIGVKVFELRISTNPLNPELSVGDSTNVTFSVTPSNLSGYSWSLESVESSISASISSTSGATAIVTVKALEAGNGQFRIRCDVAGATIRTECLVFTADESRVTRVTITGPSSVESGGQLTLVATTSPSDATNRHVTWVKVNGSSYYSIRSFDTATGGRCVITAHSGINYNRSCSIRAVAADGGGASTTHEFTIYPATVYVSSIDAQVVGTSSTVQVGREISIVGTSYPTNADNRRLSATIRSGSQYATISTSTTSTGARTVVRGVSPGEVTIRFTANDGGGAYGDVTITVIEATELCTDVIVYDQGVRGTDGIITEISTNVGKTVDVYPGGDPYTATDTTVTPSFVSGSGVVSIQLITDDVYGSLGLSQYRLTGLTEGTAVIRFTANDGGGAYKDLTVHVGGKLNDDYPANYTKLIRLRTYQEAEGNVDNALSELLPATAAPYSLHGGYMSVPLPAGMVAMNGYGLEVTTLPTHDSAVESPTRTWWLSGSASEPGSVWVYAENGAGQVQKTEIRIVADGDYTKSVVFDANLPDGASLIGTVPATMVMDYTGESAEFIIPESDLTVEGYVMIGWRNAPGDGGDGRVYVAGDKFTVTGGDVEATLYAEWFPIPEGATGTGTSDDPFTWIYRTYDPIDITVPNAGDYPILTNKSTEYDLPEGVTATIGATEYHSYPDTPPAELGSGNIVIEGTPETVTTLEFGEIGTRKYHVWFRLIVAEGDLPEPGEDLVVTFDANGGTFPDGSGLVTVTAQDRVYTLLDWSVVDRPGYRLSHWTDAGGNRSEMGQQKNTLKTWTANWVLDDRGYSTEYLPHAAIRIYRTLDQYIDATYLQIRGGEVSALVSENQLGSATFTLLNDYRKAGHSLLAEDCSLWSSGADGPIETGMYVRIDDIQEDGTLRYLTDGFITTIKPNAENVAFEIADRLTFLSKSGTTYRRNFYGESRTSSVFDAGHDTTGLYADVSTMPADGIMDGDPYWKILTEVQSSGSGTRTVIGFGESHGTGCRIRIPADADRLESLRLTLGFMGRNAPETYSFSGTARVTSGTESRLQMWAVSYDNVGSMHTMELDMDLWGGSDEGMGISGGEAVLDLELTGHTGGGWGEVLLLLGGSGNLDVTYTNNGQEVTVSDTALDLTVTMGDWHRVTGYEQPSGGRLRVTAIDGVDSIDDASLYTPADSRCKVAYITGSQSTISMMESMSWALGLMPIVAGTPDDAMLRMFRTGGGYALDYYQKLADVPSENGRRRAFSIRGYTTPVIVVSSRHRLADEASAHIHYGGDSVTGSEERIAFASFSPSMTFKNRPNLAMVRGTMSAKGEAESVPIMVAVEDSDSTDRRYGLVVETVLADSSVNVAVDAANAAWAEVTENDLDEWEGSVTVPGIRRDLLPASGAYAGSGVALLITDSRNGIAAYPVRARELTLDFNACTTRIVLTNHSMVYSSGISDTAALAITSADVATGDNSTTLFNTQYVRIKTDRVQTIRDSGNEVRGRLETHSSTPTPFAFEDVSILQLPNGRNVLVARAPSDSDVHASDDMPHAVTAVSLNNGAWIDIRPSLRPDYYDGQTLILNLDFPTQ